MDSNAREEASGQLHRALTGRSPIDPLSEQHPDLSIDDAYAIQAGVIRHLVAAGGTVVGYKLGLTSKAMQESLGIDQPDYAAVVSDFVEQDGARLSLEEFIAPRIEAEIALVLAYPLKGPGVTPARAAGAVGGALPALEVVDSRIRDWRIGLVDTIADLASCGRIVQGMVPTPIHQWDPRLVGMVIERNGEVEAASAGAATLGNPLAALAWLANKLSDYGVALEPGQVVLTGALHRAFEVREGDHVRADFDRLGSVRCHVAE